MNFVCGSTQTISLAATEPKLDSVLRIQGYKNPEGVRRVIRDLAAIAVEAFVENATPEVSYRVAKIECVDSTGLRLESGVYLENPIFGQYLAEATQVVVFALTVGERIDQQTIEWMNQEKLVEALFLESAAWLGVEDVTKQFVVLLRKWATEQNMRISRRLGPGYSYPVNGQQIQWDLYDQHPLFQMFSDTKIAVKLLESSAMLPKMSRSGMFGLIPRQPLQA
ncbi:MAG: hypothetical protein OXI60_09990 [Acidiferrobacterales bacterium]|nr:hypothetical protein [Acidiferrobacterales bacterium]